MPFLLMTVELVARRLPTFLSPDAHRKADYAVVGGFAAAGLVYWNKDRRGAIASIICAGSLLALDLATNYDGQTRKKFSLSEHRSAELGMAANRGVRRNRY